MPQVCPRCLLVEVGLRRRVNVAPLHQVSLRRSPPPPAPSQPATFTPPPPAPSQPTTSCHTPAPSQPASSCQPPAPSQPTASCYPPAPSQPAVTSEPPHTSQLNPGESLSWPSINYLSPQIPPVLHAPIVLPDHPPPPPPPPAAAAAGNMHSETPFSGTANRVDDALQLQQPAMLGCGCDELGADVAASVKDKIWRDECAGMMRHFFAICDKFSVPIAEKKTEGPVSVITFLGLEIDAAAQSVKVPGRQIGISASTASGSCGAK